MLKKVIEGFVNFVLKMIDKIYEFDMQFDFKMGKNELVRLPSFEEEWEAKK